MHSSRQPASRYAALLLWFLVGCGGAVQGPQSPGTAPDVTSDRCVKKELRVGGSASGNTGGTLCQLVGGSGNVFTLTVTQSTAMILTVSGNSFPAYFGIYTAEGKPLDARTSNDSSLTMPVVLGPGGYLLMISSLTPAEGPYTVSAPPLDADRCYEPYRITMTKGASYTSTVGLSSCRTPNGGRRYQLFTFATGDPTTFAVTTTLDKPGQAAWLTESNEFGPGTWTARLPSAPDGMFQRSRGALLTSASGSSTSIPLAYTIRVE